MNNTQKYLCALSVFIIMAQNYESQISHVPNAAIALWTLHDWAGAVINVCISGALAWKIFLVDPNAPAVEQPTQTSAGPSKAT